MGSIGPEEILSQLFNRVQPTLDVLQFHLKTLHDLCKVRCDKPPQQQLDPRFHRPRTPAASSVYSSTSIGSPISHAIEMCQRAQQEFLEANEAFVAGVEHVAHREKLENWAEPASVHGAGSALTSVSRAGSVSVSPRTHPITMHTAPAAPRIVGVGFSRSNLSRQGSIWDSVRGSEGGAVSIDGHKKPYASSQELPGSLYVSLRTAPVPPLLAGYQYASSETLPTNQIHENPRAGQPTLMSPVPVRYPDHTRVHSGHCIPGQPQQAMTYEIARQLDTTQQADQLACRARPSGMQSPIGSFGHPQAHLNLFATPHPENPYQPGHPLAHLSPYELGLFKGKVNTMEDELTRRKKELDEMNGPDAIDRFVDRRIDDVKGLFDKAGKKKRKKRE